MNWKYYASFASVLVGLMFLWMTVLSAFTPDLEYPEMHYYYLLVSLVSFEGAAFLYADCRVKV